MKSIFCSFAAILFFASLIAAQKTASSPPTDDNSVVKISTNLIQLDVTVTDRNGKIVTGLTADDFEVFENGEKQTISGFSFASKIHGGATIEGRNAVTNAPLTPAAASLTAGQVRRTIAIVVDDMNLSFASIYYTRRALKRFVDAQMEPGDLVAIIRTGGGVGALQQFTSDRRLLHAAIDKIRWNPITGSFDSLSPVSQRDTDISERFTRETEQLAAGKNRTSILVRDHITDKKRTDYEINKNTSESEGGIRMTSSLGTVRYILTAMGKLPGRKAMMFFSDGFAITSDSNKSGASGVFDFLQKLTDVANRSSVVVYTFDTKGLRSMSIAASDSTYEIIDGHRGLKERERTRDFKESQDGLAYFANRTGGKALLNSDDLNGGIQRAMEDQNGYYLLGYQPDAETFDPGKRKFNKLEVKVKRPGLKVSYRSGFFNTAATDEKEPNLPAERLIANALMSPFAESSITLQVNALYAHDAADGSYIRSFLHIDARDLTFSDDAEGWKKATFDVTAVTFGDNGLPVENVDSKYTIKTKGATYEAMLKKGFVYVLMMPIKKPGVYQYRVALRDESSGKIGSASQVVEVPDLLKGKLAISSVAVEGVSPVIWQNISQGKVGTNPGQMQVASTLLYDTVLKQFPANTVLRYGYEVYNAKPDNTSQPRLETQIKIFQNNRAIVEGSVAKVDAAAQKDPKHLRVSGAMMLKESLPAGDYVLQIIVNDTVAKRNAVQVFPFEIIK